ncbi:uncharacterized protein N7496_000355 [Penicillium cataractarum]|uniref:Hyphally-regulated cell wall protein N-terminal domain-containing protein n=1 Tax=Penicillium cataractarum TaxID=2100454 RepID=A0A9X0B605_9EURO|nr:uncharacterized protein N7496_000355 [Penicillium cataractarum]KAJ5389287.1 hypothetical protein N7496_000355 [Penicillium cataractarum]
MKVFLLLLQLAPLISGSIVINEPSDIIPEQQWSSDNAIKADYDIPVIYYQTIANIAPYIVAHQRKTFQNAVLKDNSNDTSVLIAANGSVVHVIDTEVIKFGYSSDLIQASFFGTNAAVLAANHSQLYLSDVNITTHNGAANIYAYGTDTVVDAENIWLYSSGPTAHGLYASGNGTINARNVQVFSGGNRCSAFSGDNPAGYIYIRDSVARTAGIGSAVGFVLGEMNLTNVVGSAERSPAFFTIGGAVGSCTNCELTAGLLAGLVIFGLDKSSGVNYFSLDHTKLTITDETAPALWFGGVVGEVYVRHTELVTSSGILAVANYSTITQEFNFYAGYYDDPSAVNTADGRVFVEDSTLTGDLVAFNGSTLGLHLTDNSFWTGKGYIGYGSADLGVVLDASSVWNLTGDTALLNLTNAVTTFSNIRSNGFSITYNASAPANRPLRSRTFKLEGGGTVSPMSRK